MITVGEDGLLMPLENNNIMNQLANADGENSIDHLTIGFGDLWTGNGGQHLQDSLNEHFRSI